MMTCRVVRQQLSAYLDGELPEAHAAHLRAHLARCTNCATHRDELTAVVGLLDVISEISPGDGFATGVLARVREREAESALARLGRAIWRPLPGWAVAAAFVAAITVGSGLAWLAVPGPEPALRVADRSAISRQFGLEAFEDLPEDSVGGAYVRVAWPQGGDGG
jgi:anti-sigma factor RsiW